MSRDAKTNRTPKRRCQKSEGKHRTVHLAALFFALLAGVALLSFLLMILSIAVVYRLLLASEPDRVGLLIQLSAISSIAGALLALVLARPALQAVGQLSRATVQVAQGDFTVKLPENSRVTELHTMAHNFNLMTQELAHTELLRNDFIRNVSHEFKTPISAIEGYATLLQTPALSEEKRQLYAEKILHSTRRLTSLTGNILQLSRLENQQTNTETEVFSLDEQLRETLLLFEKDWNEKNLELDLRLATVKYRGNRELLAQVWQNLIGNAVKFCRKGGYICIHLEETPGAVRVSVTDSGIGMSPETAARVFEKFYQGDTSHATAGNGLGLTLAKRIIELHGGTITVSSKEGKGSTFTVYLPSSKPPAPQLQQE